MPQKGLNRADVRAALEKMRGKAVSECVRADSLDDPGLPDGFGNGLVNGTWIKMMPSNFATPSPVLCGMWVLPGKGMRQVDLPIAVSEVLIMNQLHAR